MTKPTLLIVTDRLGDSPENGAQVIASAIVDTLARWFEIIAVVPEGSNPRAPACLAVHEVSPRSIDDESISLALPTVALVYNFGGTSFACRAGELIHRRLGVPLVNHFQINLECHGLHQQLSSDHVMALRMDQARAARSATRNLFASHSELMLALAAWGMTTGDNYVVPNPFVPAPESASVAATDVFTFFAAGRFSDYSKGADLLYRAFRDLIASGLRARLAIAGDRDRFVSLLHGLPADTWTFQQWMPRSELLGHMRAADVVVVPSRYEPFGLVAVEALAMGTAVIATEVGGLQEIVHHAVTGWLTPPREGSLGLSRAMRRAFDAGRQTVKAMGDAAAGSVRAEYSFARFIQGIRLHLDNARRALNGA